MRVLYLVPSFYPAICHGGPIFSGYHLCNALSQKGIDLRVLTTDTNGPHQRLPVTEFPTRAAAGYPIYYSRRVLAVSVSPSLLWSMISMIRWADLVHLTAVYSFPTIPALIVCRLLNKPVVWSPRGSLQRWTGSRRRSLKYVWEKTCRLVAPRKIVLHVTSEMEAKESSARFPAIPSVIIPHGVEVPQDVEHVDSAGGFRILYLGRLDPKKGIENLLLALKNVNGHLATSWSLKVAGSGDIYYTKSIKELIERLGLGQRVEMLGEVAGEAKKKLFASADIVVVPSYTENFGLVVAEALSHAVPVIASIGTPWQRLDEVGCGLWVDSAPASLAKAVEKMSLMPLREAGSRGRQWMEAEFSWDRRALEMIGLYEKLIVQ